MAPGGPSARPPLTPGISKTVTRTRCGTPLSPSVLTPGSPLRDMPEAASHAGPRTTMRHYLARGSQDRYATYIVAANVAGDAR